MTLTVKSNVSTLTDLLEDYPVKLFPNLGVFIVNKMAFEARKQSIKRVKRQFITRNKFTTNRIIFKSSPKVTAVAFKLGFFFKMRLAASIGLSMPSNSMIPIFCGTKISTK